MSKYYGKYRARVIDINDPEERGRIRVECPKILGKSKSAWCETCVPVSYERGGDFGVPPHLGDTVWVEFEEGDWNKPIWVGNWWSKQNTTVPDALNLMENLKTYEDAVGKIRTIEWRGIRLVFAEDDKKWRFVFDMVNGENKTKFEVIHDSDKEFDEDTITLTTEHSVTVNVNGKYPEAILNVTGENTAEVKVNMDSEEKTSIEVDCNSKQKTEIDIYATSNENSSFNLEVKAPTSNIDILSQGENPDISVKCLGEKAVIDIESSKKINMKCEDLNITASKTISMTSEQSTTINGGNLLTAKAGDIYLN